MINVWDIQILVRDIQQLHLLVEFKVEVQNLCRVLYQAAGIDNASSHSGRRTFITTLSERGVSVRVIQALARHSSLSTTQPYIDVSVDKLRCAVEVLSF